MADTSTTSSQSHFDLIVIGGGPGGYAAALYGASAGLNIALIEQDKVGGTCLHRGCIPAKELLESAAVYRTVRHASDFGVNVAGVTVDWSVTVDRKQRVIDQMFTGLSSLLKSRKVSVFSGIGHLESPGVVSVRSADGESAVLTGDAVLLATGSIPRTIPGFVPDGSTIFTSDEFLDLRRLPQTAAVIGGGAIGCEFATTLADMGTQVTILEGLDKILPSCDSDITKVVERAFKKKGITTKTGVTVNGYTPLASGGASVMLGDGSTLDVDIVVVSVGRAPIANGVVADSVGVGVSDRGFFEVDENCRTAIAGVWAVGDCIATPQLAHVAFMEGMNVI